VKDIIFDLATMYVPALSPQHFRTNLERGAGPLIKVVESLAARDPTKLMALRNECDALVAEYYEENMVRQGYLLTRATKI
jgi:hypothetical protein